MRTWWAKERTAEDGLQAGFSYWLTNPSLKVATVVQPVCDGDYHPILDPREYDHEGTCHVSIMVGKCDDGSMVSQHPGAYIVHMSAWMVVLLTGIWWPLCLGPAKGQTIIIEFPDARWVTDVKKKGKKPTWVEMGGCTEEGDTPRRP